MEFYLLGYWQNPYRKSDKEYFWSGPYDSRKEAAFYGQLKQKRGQPRGFINWGKGTNKIFSSLEGFLEAAKKVGLNPAVG